MQQVNLTTLNELVKTKYLSVQKHPTAPLLVWNYTRRTQFENCWIPETIMCRGLITDLEGNIKARPFPKFYNLSEHIDKGGKIPIEKFEVFEKYDGSLLIGFWINNKFNVTTRGSFTSDQALKGMEIINKKYPHLHINQQWTPLMELIVPTNRIVVNYGSMENVVLLAIIETTTGNEMQYSQLKEIAKLWGMPLAKKYEKIKDITKLTETMPSENKEGFVIRFESGLRLKFKFSDYIRLHKLVTGINARRIWDLLKNNQPLDELLERTPDEFFDWVKKIKLELESQYTLIQTQTLEDMVKITAEMEILFCDGTGKDNCLKNHRKYFTEKALHTKYPSLLLAMLDNKDIKKLIWKMIKPGHEIPFKIEI